MAFLLREQTEPRAGEHHSSSPNPHCVGFPPSAATFGPPLSTSAAASLPLSYGWRTVPPTVALGSVLSSLTSLFTGLFCSAPLTLFLSVRPIKPPPSFRSLVFSATAGSDRAKFRNPGFEFSDGIVLGWCCYQQYAVCCPFSLLNYRMADRCVLGFRDGFASLLSASGLLKPFLGRQPFPRGLEKAGTIDACILSM